LIRVSRKYSRFSPIVSTIESPKIAIEYDDFLGKIIGVGLGVSVNSGAGDKITDVDTAFTDSSSFLGKLDRIYKDESNMKKNEIAIKIDNFFMTIIIPF